MRSGQWHLPDFAREAGGRVRDGIGAYYRQLLAPVRRLEATANGNWASRYANGGQPDHYAHAEIYALLAKGQLVGRVGGALLGFNLEQRRFYPIAQDGKLRTMDSGQSFAEPSGASGVSQ